MKNDWRTIRDGIEVKLCQVPGQCDSDAMQIGEESPPASTQNDREMFILCRSQDRLKKDEAIIRRSEAKI
ncbi:hypothetical protein [Novipirellula artificiosorum]|uniref:hypothetical protein n=1 Tax=Novipirellula artificiosorum TaxID=2528016 RepID=UPI0011B50228|nr:hypothetical protein [Novipirellula artificiosorum]